MRFGLKLPIGHFGRKSADDNRPEADIIDNRLEYKRMNFNTSLICATLSVQLFLTGTVVAEQVDFGKLKPTPELASEAIWGQQPVELNIAEIFYESGELRFRYARYLSPDGVRWIRHGLFTEFHRNGQLASQGMYADGVEEGSWQDFYENGQMAAEGTYYRGAEAGIWRYWSHDGREEIPENRSDSPLVE